MTTPLRDIITAASQGASAPLKDFTVLSPGRDPYRLDTQANHALGQWLAKSWREVNPHGDRLHVRGLHYRMVGRVAKPDGELYVNDADTWTWLAERVIKAARFLGYLAWGALRDARNSPPQIFTRVFNPPEWRLSVGEVEVYLPDSLEPELTLSGDLARQPFRQILIAEKQGVGDLLLPVVQRYQACLALPAGELSDQQLYDLLAADDGRPVVIHQLGDFDPSGHQMAVSTARTAQALRDSQFPHMDIKVHAIALTLEQVRDWGLPETPLKETERRADRWQAAMGWAQTELDAAVALAPRKLRGVVAEALGQYWDPDLAERESALRAELVADANAQLAMQIGPETIAEMREQAQAQLEGLQEQVDEINDALRIDAGGLGLGLGLHIPETLTGYAEENLDPLIDTRWDWPRCTASLIARKAYAGGGE